MTNVSTITFCYFVFDKSCGDIDAYQKLHPKRDKFKESVKS